MKPKYLALVLLPLLINAAHAAAPGTLPQTGSEAGTSSTQRFADRCTDFTTNGWAFKAPRNFLKWLDAFTDPAIYLEFANRSLDPQSYVRTLSSMLDPGTPRNYLEWSNPEIYNQWAQAAAEPEFYTAVNSILFDPGRLMRWVMLPVDGRAWSVLGNAINPDTWLKWLNAPIDPKTQELFAKAANPETTRLWFEALGDPKNTPWLNIPTTPYGAQPTMLPGLGKQPETTRIKL
jgi:hypothetical protein